MPPKKKKNYVNNKDLLHELAIYNKEKRYTEELGKMLLAMATQISFRREFRYYTYIEDMITESVLTCLKYLHNFNVEKSSNAFAYLSMIIFNSFKLYIKREQKHSKIKDKALHLRQGDIQREILGSPIANLDICKFDD